MPEPTGGEKVLPASPRKRERAREQGNVAKSQDLNAAITLLIALLALWALGPVLFGNLMGLTRHYFQDAHVLTTSHTDTQSLTFQVLAFTVPGLVPLMLLLLVAGVVINIAQFGVIFTAQPLTPKFERINPISGFQKFFALRTLVEFAKSVLKLTFVTWIVYLTLRNRWEELLSLTHMSPWDGSALVWDLIFTVWWRIVLAMLVIGLLDYGFQRWQYERDLMMTHQEAREELKELEGDPRIRQRIRQIQRQMAMQRMMREVPAADVVITNPTRYAIALRYDMQHMDAPTVVAKGARLLAERIRNVAVENDVPIVERPDLARTLYQSVEVGQPVPEKLFRAVAEVLAYVYQIDRREQKIRERAEMNAGAPAHA